MSEPNFKQQLLQLFISNEEARNEIKSAASPDEAFKTISKYIEGISMDEFVALMKEIYSSYEKYQQALLSDLDLKKTSANDGDTITTLTTTTTVYPAASASVAAAI